MSSRILFLLVTVCVVKASVSTGNVVDDDPAIDILSSPKSCNSQECHQRCRRLKFPGGACFKDRCKCDNFRNAEDEVSEEEVFDLENLLSLEDHPEAEVAATPSRCRDRACDVVCRFLNNTSGACVDGRCKCTKSITAEDALTDSDVEDSISPRACNNNRCNQICRKQKFRGGACVGANCYCNKFLSQQEVSEDLEDSVSPKRCTVQACNNLCRGLGFGEGVCTSSRCRCRTFYSTPEDTVDEFSELDTRYGCKTKKCNRTCTRLGYDSGSCVSRRCRCYNKTQAQAEISETSLPVSELSEDQNQTERGCNPQACEQLCRRMKFPGGACVNGRCKCDNFFRTEDAVDEYSELDERRVCRISKCNRTCTRRGYGDASCVSGRCKCYNKIPRQDASPLNDVTNDEHEESNEILTTNEEELTDGSPRSCNTPNCNQMCHRIKYAGGWCRFGRCECY